MDNLLSNLKLKLQHFGALRPEAWEEMKSLLEIYQLKMGESYLREIGDIAFIAEGLLKEYQVRENKRPSIVNFLALNQVFYTTAFRKEQYLKVEIDSIVLRLTSEKLRELHVKFPELKTIYDQLCYEYDEQLAFRQTLLTLTNVERVNLARKRFKDIFPYLKKKDVANYLHISYNYLIHIW
jgi:CRP-like cAMP-binding protein